jgi:acyl-CoA thioesterase-2
VTASPEAARVLDLEQVEDTVFLGRTPPGPRTQIYGGQVVAQALVAAGRTVPADRDVHSLHSYFLKLGDPSQPIRFEVDRLRDGGSFTTRHVTASQGGAVIFEQSSSYQRPEAGWSHQLPQRGDVPTPADLPTAAEQVATFDPVTQAWWHLVHTMFPLEVRFCDEPVRARVLRGERPEPRQRFYIRFTDPLGGSALDHACALAFLSDLFLLSTTVLPHGLLVGETVSISSLDHAVWFHAPFRADEWLLYDMEGSWAGGARGLSQGHVFDAAGTLVATTVQEGLLRRPRPPRA